MKYGTYTWFGYALPMLERLKLIKEAGFDTICSWWGDTFIDLDGRKEDHFEMALKEGLHLEHTHLPYYKSDLLWETSLDADNLESEYGKDIENAASSGIATIVIHPYSDFNITKVGDWDIFIGRIERLGDIALRKGVRLAIENLRDYKTIGKIIDCLGDNKNLGICFDTGHGNISNHDDFSLLEEYPHKIFALHIHDNDGLKDQHLLPYGGNLPWHKFKKALEATYFKGSFMLEAAYPFEYDENMDEVNSYVPPPISPETYLKNAILACKKVFRGSK